MNTIEIPNQSIEDFEYEHIRGFVKHLEGEPEKNRGALVIRFPELEATEPVLFLHKGIQSWYMGLLNNVPNILYFLSDEHEEKQQWTPLQFAVMMYGDIRVTESEDKTITYVVKYHEDMFKEIMNRTARYMAELNGKPELTIEQKDFFSHIFFDYTNGFYQ